MGPLVNRWRAAGVHRYLFCPFFGFNTGNAPPPNLPDQGVECALRVSVHESSVPLRSAYYSTYVLVCQVAGLAREG
jgi:hypothetical protein